MTYLIHIKQQIKVPHLSDNVEDRVIWRAGNGTEHKFAVRQVWKDLSRNGQKVHWSSVVWFAQCIPKHAFVMWLAVHNKLLTQDRILIWKPNEDLKCALCNKCPDFHSHLFFSCEYGQEIWIEIQKLLNVKFLLSWNAIVEELIRLSKNNIWSVLRRIVCGATVYYICQERNSRLFKNEKRDVKTVLTIFKEAVKIRMMGLIVKESATVKEVKAIWGLKLQRPAIVCI